MDGVDAVAATADRGDTVRVPLFERFDAADVRALIEEYPLAWVCEATGGTFDASLLPLVGVYDGEGRLVELAGHLMRSNPLHHALKRHPGATILFNGPSGYVSPEHAGRRDWAPTWNYAQLKIAAEVTFDDSLTDWSLDLLIEAMEQARARPWESREMGERYAVMREYIIGFRARVTRVSGKFKLGQDERPETLHHILATLPDGPLVTWMRRFNRGR